ncbi:aspartate/glutamate racemase family protein [Amycolatopsis sp. OK19-0408]|uniref:Aspartate/glutamate racemase family protein n=1 Tax=Amycolatopsis iheyensis TaxID=2945988 RepID=A0A9X2SHJ0_9PSEU|nr:aspartate/glutamate racemase family protein [Amycolatopsis iheyensis]MCR6481883.1 aspartate/glutamate racemase family protein [Amycolatopsis iheyensis]
MKVIGLLGGMSWESSAEYYRLVNERVKDALGGFHSAHTVLYSVDFAAIEAMQADGRWDEAGAELNRAARALEAAGADFVVLCTNTMHKVADRLEDGLGIPLLHLADATAAAVTAAGIRRIGLLGTGFTMAQPFYRDRLAAHGLDVLVPGEEDRDLVHRVIYDELVLGVVKPESREAYRGVIARLAEAGAEGVIYGCTEIELLVGPEDSPVPTFPTTRLHAEAAVDFALGAAELPRPPA